jgi:hypothetical protein
LVKLSSWATFENTCNLLSATNVPPSLGAVA